MKVPTATWLLLSDGFGKWHNNDYGMALTNHIYTVLVRMLLANRVTVPMSDHAYAVVEFVEDCSVDIVPSVWMSLDNKKALLSQRWPRDAPYVYLQAIHPNFVHAYGHYTMCGFWFWTNLSSGNFVYFCKTDVLAVQGHPRSLILVPLESAYATSY